jgi:UDP-glucose 4-epimerase
MGKKRSQVSRVLVTGGSGFVGKHLLKKLQNKGYEITCLLRENGNSVKGFTNINESELINSDLTLDAVIHLAGLAHISSQKAAKKKLCFEQSNNELTFRVVELAKSKNVKIFINLSSIAVVAGSSSKQIIDDYFGGLPRSPYAQSKYQGERHVKTLKQNNCLAVSLRPPLIIGLGAKGNWAKLIRIASTKLPLPFKEINNQRSLLSIDDLCDRIITILSQDPTIDKSGEYCIASSPPLSISEIIHEIRAAHMEADRMFPVPSFVWKAIYKVPIISQLLEKMIEDLVLDDTRFRNTFKYNKTYPVKQQIRSSVDVHSVKN